MNQPPCVLRMNWLSEEGDTASAKRTRSIDAAYKFHTAPPAITPPTGCPLSNSCPCMYVRCRPDGRCRNTENPTGDAVNCYVTQDTNTTWHSQQTATNRVPPIKQPSCRSVFHRDNTAPGTHSLEICRLRNAGGTASDNPPKKRSTCKGEPWMHAVSLWRQASTVHFTTLH